MAWLEKRHGKYRICYRDDAGKTRRTVAYSDKAASKQMMADLERALAHGERGLVDPFQAHRGRPLVEHVTDWVASLRERGKDDMYVAPCEARVMRLSAECGWRTLADIDADAFDRWRETATSKVAHNRKYSEGADRVPMGARTKNHYLETLRAFCNWCVKRKRIGGNPVAHVEKVDQAGALRRERRPLTEDELGRLLAAVPDEYQLLYRVALATGLRMDELRQLRWGGLRLANGDKPHVQLRAKATKARRADFVPLRAELAELLTLTRGVAIDGDNVFARVPRATEHRRWLAAAGIPYTDAEGRRADLHALRHTYGTLLSKAGVSPREAMELMRHTDLRQAMKVYTDPRLFNLSAAVERLPSIDLPLIGPKHPDGVGAGGTRVAIRVATCVVQGQSQVPTGRTHGAAQSSEVPLKEGDRHLLAGTGIDVKRAGDGIRTHDVQLGKLAFYH